jgi:hypothetical protein
MNLADQLSENLDAWQPVSEGPMLHTVSLPGWTVHLQADRADRVGCQLSEFSLVRNAPSPDGLTMTSWAEGIARRVTGLLEPLKLLEADPDRKQALLRSTAPTRKGDLARYYELQLTGTTKAALRRYEADLEKGTPRKAIPFSLTHEVMAKLAGDVAGE